MSDQGVFLKHSVSLKSDIGPTLVSGINAFLISAGGVTIKNGLLNHPKKETLAAIALEKGALNG